MNQLRVVKRVLPAELLLVDGTRLVGSLFLADRSPRHSGPQTVGELMAAGERTLPFHDPDGRFVLIGKGGVAAVVEAALNRGADDLWERIPVTVRTAGSHRLVGHYLAERGCGNRLSDALNAADPWFRLESSEQIIWVAKDHLLSVEPG